MSKLRILSIIAISVSFQNEIKAQDKCENCAFVKVFYDHQLNPVDSSKSAYWGYEFRDNDKPVYYFHRKRNKHLINQAFDFPEPGKPLILDGKIDFIELNRKGYPSVYIEMIFKNGYPYDFTTKHFQGSNASPYYEECIQFHQQYNNQVGSYFGIERKYGEISKKYWFLYSKNRFKYMYIN